MPLITTEALLTIATIIVCTSSYVFYFRGIFKQGVKPHLFSWLIWGITMCIGAAAGISNNGGIGSWIILACGIATLSIAAFAVKYGEKKITKLDWICLFVALSSIPLWLLTDNALAAVIVVTVIDVIGYAPTLRKSWHKPWEENIPAFVIGTFQFGLILMTIQNYNLTTTLYALAIMFMNIAVTTQLILRRKKLPKEKPLR